VGGKGVWAVGGSQQRFKVVLRAADDRLHKGSSVKSRVRLLEELAVLT
jgi:hypothetical protein